MNLLEHFLVEVIKIEKFDEDWTEEYWAKDKDWLWVTATFACYGRKDTHRRVYSREQWDNIVKQGYYLG